MPLCADDLRTIPERVFCQLREAIVEGEIPPGSRISEAELAARYGISRAPLREAISRLAAVGLIERRPNVGARVIELSAEQLIDIFHVRESLEGTAARQAAERMSAEAVDRLRETLDDHARRMQQEGGHAYFQEAGDVDFHYQIIKGTGNGHLIKLLCHDLYHLIRMYRCQFGMRSKRGPAALEEHRAIAAAIERRDGELAELLMRAHVRASRENVERILCGI
ncbi:MAG: GntR family transcriptional regulator [Gammaproteobacteria bacterium]|nr:MAG: GntR family transcriptional regulator [Gammaproteobacteria bacterium]